MSFFVLIQTNHLHICQMDMNIKFRIYACFPFTHPHAFSRDVKNLIQEKNVVCLQRHSFAHFDCFFVQHWNFFLFILLSENKSNHEHFLLQFVLIFIGISFSSFEMKNSKFK